MYVYITSYSENFFLIRGHASKVHKKYIREKKASRIRIFSPIDFFLISINLHEEGGEVNGGLDGKKSLLTRAKKFFLPERFTFGKERLVICDSHLQQ